MTNPLQTLRGTGRWLRAATFGLTLAAVMLASGIVAAQSPQTSYTFKVIYDFCSLPNCADGSTPYAGLIGDAKGVGFGTTYFGGTCSLSDDCGTVFEVTKGGKETVLYSFMGESDGESPVGGLVRDSEGSLYGTASYGGDLTCNPSFYGCGTVFKLTAAGQFTVLHNFTGMPDGLQPLAGLLRDAAGNLYGTTAYGGRGQCATTGAGCGTVFKIDSAGNETVLYAFAGGSDGFQPEGGLVMDKEGNLYGTTFGDGTAAPGTVFKVTPSGQETVLYTFKNGSDGNAPRGTLIMDAQGNLYGTTSGGVNGTVFKLSKSGEETVLWDFQGYPDGSTPEAGVVMDAAGNLYGTTQLGGDINAPNCSFSGGCGTVFEVSKDGVERVLYAFEGGSDGGFPVAPVILDGKDNLYGTTPDYGYPYGGNVFTLIK